MMKLNRFFNIFLLLILCALTIFAQDKSSALKFDEFEFPEDSIYSYNETITILQRAERFAKQLKTRQGFNAFIIYYQARITDTSAKRKVEYAASNVKSTITSNSDFDYESVFVINGGFREKSAFEFWIAPKDAEMPKLTPTFQKSEAYICPKPTIYSELSKNETDTIGFTIFTYSLKELENYTWNWKVSDGEIIEGQGSDFIKVKLKTSAPKNITAFLELEDLPFPCQKVFSTTAEIGEKRNIILIDSFGDVPSGDMKARLDALFSELRNNPSAKGYIINYGNRSQGNRSLARRNSFIRTFLKFRGVDLSQITISEGGFREETSSELWISFDANEKPVPTPTVDTKFINPPTRRQNRSAKISKN